MNKKIKALHLDCGTFELGLRPAERNDEYICEIVEVMESGQMAGVPVYEVYLEQASDNETKKLWQKIPSGMCRVEYTFCAESIFAVEKKNELPF